MLFNPSSKSIWSYGLFQAKGLELGLNMSLPIVIGCLIIALISTESSILTSIIEVSAYLSALIIFDACYLWLSSEKLPARSLIIELTALGMIQKNRLPAVAIQRHCLLFSSLFLLLSSLLCGVISGTFFPELKFFSSAYQFYSLSLIIFNFLPIYPSKTYFISEAYYFGKKQYEKFYRITEYLNYFCIFLIFLTVQFGNIFLLTICSLLTIFTFSKAQSSRMLMEFTKYRIEDVMIPSNRMICFSALLTISKAAYIAVNSFQESFPVLQDRQLIGMINKSDLIKNIALSEDQYLRGLMTRPLQVIRVDHSMEEVAQAFQYSNLSILPVIDAEGIFLGLIDRSKVSEFNLVRSLENHKINDDQIEL